MKIVIPFTTTTNRSLVTDVYVAVTYPPAPKSGFVIKQSIGSCIRGMQPLVASV